MLLYTGVNFGVEYDWANWAPVACKALPPRLVALFGLGVQRSLAAKMAWFSIASCHALELLLYGGEVCINAFIDLTDMGGIELLAAAARLLALDQGNLLRELVDPGLSVQVFAVFA